MESHSPGLHPLRRGSLKANIAGSIIDKTSGEQVAAKVQVLTSQGRYPHPPDAILKEGTGDPFFYSDGTFEVGAVERGPVRITVERGTEYVPAVLELEAPSHGTLAVDIELERWTDLGDRGWHPGNTHIHYRETETRPDDRLQLDPRVEDLRMTAISILKRGDLNFATNRYPIGMLTDFSTAHHYVQNGEENRHNFSGAGSPYGYGHVMLLNIKNIVEPVSRGVLVDTFDPDYPPLSYACDEAHSQGGITIWCHNGLGIELPVAAALGKVDAFNLFDNYWMDPEYDVYYQMLNAGIRMPVSTGSDWYICCANRVYSYTGGEFEYESWLQALKDGKTFITNGPALSLTVQEEGPGGEIEAHPDKPLSTLVTWTSHSPVSRVEVLFNGRVVAGESFPDGSKGGELKADVPADSDGWIAARTRSDVRDSYHQPIFAHTSPVYVKTGVDSPERGEAARLFDASIERDLEFARTRGKFYTDGQRREIVDLFRQGQQVYKDMLK